MCKSVPGPIEETGTSNNPPVPFSSLFLPDMHRLIILVLLLYIHGYIDLFIHIIYIYILIYSYIFIYVFIKRIKDFKGEH